MFISVFFLLAACSGDKEVDSSKTAGTNTDSQKIQVTNTKEVDNTVKEEATAENQEAESQEPTDAGSMEIKFEGKVSLNNRTLTVTGMSNLLEGSEIYVNIDWAEGYLIGGNRITTIEKDGTFTYETELPEIMDGYLTVEIKFEPARQNDTIKAHYGESGEQLKGPFVRLYDYSSREIVYHKASAIVELSQAIGKTEAEITAPKWEIPDDYGSTNIRMDSISVSKDENYLYIDGKSNLLEGTQLWSKASLPGYITSGFVDTSYVNPDGSFRIIIENPETNENIKQLTDYEIVIEMSLLNSTYANVLEAYGEHGEHLTGDLIDEDSNGKFARIRLKESKE